MVIPWCSHYLVFVAKTPVYIGSLSSSAEQFLRVSVLSEVLGLGLKSSESPLNKT